MAVETSSPLSLRTQATAVSGWTRPGVLGIICTAAAFLLKQTTQQVDAGVDGRRGLPRRA